MNETHELVVLGDSHTVCFRELGKAANDDSGTSQGVTRPFVAHWINDNDMVENFVERGDDGSVGLNARLEAAITELGLGPAASPRRLVLSYGGSQWYRDMFEYSWEDYDFIVPQRPDLELRADRELLPHDLVSELLGDRLSRVREGYRLLRDRGFEDVWLLTPPPPHGNEEKMATLLALVRERKPESLPLPRPILRIKIGLVYRELLRSLAREFGFGLVDTWRLAATTEGFLRPEYELDGFHANAAYARDVLAEPGIWLDAA